MTRVQLALAGVAASALLLGGCATKNPQNVAVPVAVPVASLPAAEPTASSGAENNSAALTSELQLDHERVVVPPLRPGELVASARQPEEPDTPPRAVPSRKPPARTSQPAAPRPTPVEPEVEPEPVRPESRPPSLKPMLSDTDRRLLRSQTEAHLERARRNLAVVQVNRLEQSEVNALTEARNFVARAEQLRDSDPVLANSLAERAAILSQEVLRKQR